MLIRQPCRGDDKLCGNHQPTSTLPVKQLAVPGDRREGDSGPRYQGGLVQGALLPSREALAENRSWTIDPVCSGVA